MFRRGYLQLFRWRGTPVRAHWTVPLGALFFTGLVFAPVAWLAFFAVILIHELGHAVVVRRYGHRVAAIELTGFGGLCRWSGDATPHERAAIAWGGVLAQAALFLVTWLAVVVLGSPRGPLGELASVFLRTNAWLIGINLLPIPPLDGAEAWRFFQPPSRLRRAVSRIRARLSRWGRKRPSPDARPTVPSARMSSSRWSRKPPVAPPASRDVAESLRRIGDEARHARRG